MSASSVTAWTDQAMLSGAVTIAPRWSAAGGDRNGDRLLARDELAAAGARVAATIEPARRTAMADGVSREIEEGVVAARCQRRGGDGGDGDDRQQGETQNGPPPGRAA